MGAGELRHRGRVDEGRLRVAPRDTYRHEGPTAGVFVGHGLLAFAIGALAARAAGQAPERALWFGLVAGAFGLAPDVDIIYAPVGVVGAATLMGAAEGFWATGNAVHRAVTHSLLVGGATAGAVGALTREGRAWQAVGGAALAGLLVVTAAVSGVLGLVVMAVFLATAVAIAAVGRRAGLSSRVVAAAALVGLLTHPFGDLLTGSPPAMLYPLDVQLVSGRIDTFADPTLALLVPFALELAVAWVAVLAYLRVTPGPVAPRLRASLSRRAVVGVAFGLAALALPAPTLETSYHFVLPAVAVGIVGAHPIQLGRRPLGVVATGLATLTLAVLAYAVAYLALAG